MIHIRGSVTYGFHVILRKKLRLLLTVSYAAFHDEKWEKVPNWT